MASTENKTVPSGRDRLRERYSKKYPDKKFDEEGGDDELFGYAADDLDTDEKELGQARESRDRMNALFRQDNRAATFLDRWAGGDDPLIALIEEYGDDFTEALNDPARKEDFKKAHDKWLERTAREAKDEETYTANMEKTADTLHEFAEEKGLSDDEALALFQKIHDNAVSAYQGLYTKEMFQAEYNAGNYDRDVAQAKADGEVAGRNENIRAKLKESEAEKNMPPSLGGKADSVKEDKPKKKNVMKDFFGI